MLEIKPIEQEYPTFDISTDEGKFRITYGGNGDLYWIYWEKDDNEPEIKSFTITKENYYFYSLLDELYESIKEVNFIPIIESDFCLRYCETAEQIQELYSEHERWRKIDKIIRDENGLFNNEIIKWHSDETTYDKASVLTIKKEIETFLITFQKSNEESYNDTYGVRIRNSGSRYTPFNIPFNIMYKKMFDYDWNNPQIHIEEYVYQKKLEKKL